MKTVMKIILRTNRGLLFGELIAMCDRMTSGYA